MAQAARRRRQRAGVEGKSHAPVRSYEQKPRDAPKRTGSIEPRSTKPPPVRREASGRRALPEAGNAHTSGGEYSIRLTAMGYGGHSAAKAARRCSGFSVLLHQQTRASPNSGALPGLGGSGRSGTCLICLVEHQVLQTPHGRRQPVVVEVVVQTTRCRHKDVGERASAELPEIALDISPTNHAQEAHVVEGLYMGYGGARGPRMSMQLGHTSRDRAANLRHPWAANDGLWRMSTGERNSGARAGAPRRGRRAAWTKTAPAAHLGRSP